VSSTCLIRYDRNHYTGKCRADQGGQQRHTGCRSSSTVWP
jgi:hypothetical protein